MRGFPSIADLCAEELGSEIDRFGYSVVRNFVTPVDLEAAHEFVRLAVARNDGESTAFRGYKELEGTFLARLANDPSFRELCDNLYAYGAQQPPTTEEFQQLLRCLSGSSAEQHSFRFHFDTYLVTALIPIVIPQRGVEGKLIIHPNTRPVRSSYVTNVIDKLQVDNRWAQQRWKSSLKTGAPETVRLLLRPGDLYLFWGYRSLHTNEPCDPDEIRATALFHLGDPHEKSRLKRLLRRPV